MYRLQLLIGGTKTPLQYSLFLLLVPKSSPNSLHDIAAFMIGMSILTHSSKHNGSLPFMTGLHVQTKSSKISFSEKKLAA
jgi:hypothetical protein